MGFRAGLPTPPPGAAGAHFPPPPPPSPASRFRRIGFQPHLDASVRFQHHPHRMFEALVITLREGVEAALVLAIALSLLRRRGLERLSGALFAGAALALAASVATAAALTRVAWNEELAEGIAMLAGAGLVLTLVWWMWKSGPHMKRQIESGLERAAGGAAGGSAGGRLAVFLFAFGMVYREGVETAVFLSATSFNSQGVGRW